MNKSLKYLSVILILIFVTSCQDILECVINRHPELPDRMLATGQVDQYFFEEIKAEIKNEPRDDSYYYYFSIEGDLPRGLEYIIDYRSVIIQGFPLEPGRFNFTVRLSVEQANDYFENCESTLNDCDGLCKETTSQRYSVRIQQ
ncbi:MULTISPECIES: hypothetical protein [Aestuariivivens]|uniref:hypothetical protein n=1 Tax=Aestuariivivens TaxID=1820275 RepID=UPI001CBE47DF|nr:MULTISPECIES: hypothetical protein [Aestuariivivens]